MRFPRSTRLFRGQLDLAPFLCVIFVTAFALVLRDFLVLPRGALLDLPDTEAQPALEPGQPFLIVAMDASRRLYFDNQITDRAALEVELSRRASRGGHPNALLIQADQSVPYGELADLAALARRAGIQEIVLGATRSRVGRGLPR